MFLVETIILFSRHIVNLLESDWHKNQIDIRTFF